MARYSTNIQCPDSGHPITIRYAFGRLTVQADPVEGIEGERIEPSADTLAWAKRVEGRYPTVDDANRALRAAGVDGFELLDREGR
jgi:hypothetical protein